MNKVAAGLLGAVIGFFLFGAAGYGLGLLYLVWFGPEFCCGFEGIYPVVIGTLVGVLLGAAVGALAALVLVRRSPLKLMRLVVLLCIGVAILWVASLFTGHHSAENTPLILVFLGVSLVIPALLWVTDVWEKPKTSI